MCRGSMTGITTVTRGVGVIYRWGRDELCIRGLCAVEVYVVRVLLGIEC